MESLKVEALHKEGERERIKKEQAIRAAVLLRLEKALSEATKADSSKLCLIRNVGGWLNIRYSLVPSWDDDSLTLWRIKSVATDLAVSNRLDRFLCIMKNSGKVGWVRLGKKVITFVDLSRYGTATFANESCFLIFRAVWDEKDISRQNMQVQISLLGSYRDSRLKEFDTNVDLWLTPTNLTVLNIYAGRNQMIKDWIEANSDEFARRVIAAFLSPYKPYSGRLSGPRATEFFGPAGSYHNLLLHYLEGKALFVVS